MTYSIKVESQKQMEELTSELTTTFSDSTVFTKELQKTMTNIELSSSYIEDGSIYNLPKGWRVQTKIRLKKG